MVFENGRADSQKGALTLQELVSAAVAGLSARLSWAGEPPKTETTPAPAAYDEPRRILLMRQAIAVEKAQRLGLPISAAYGLMEPPPTVPPPPAVAPTAPPPVATAPSAAPEAPPARTLKVPGGLLAARMLRDGQTDAFLFWCVTYTLDIDNDRLAPARGWVPVAEVRDALLPLVGHDRFYRLLRAAAKAGFVTRARRWDGTPVIFYRARLKLGLDLGLDTLGEPVRLPFDLVAAADDWKAALFAALHVGRARAAGPISRETLQALTGLPARTQRLYEQRIGITPQANLCLSRLDADHRDLMAALDVRPGSFTYFDKRSKSEYVAWHLPNSYMPPATCTRARSGMNRKHNRFLRRSNRLLNGGWQCNGREGDAPRYPRIFWPDVQAAEAARDKVPLDQPGVPSAFTPAAPEVERFAPCQTGRGAAQRITRAGRALWLLVPARLPAMCEPAALARQLESVFIAAQPNVGQGARQSA